MSLSRQLWLAIITLTLLAFSGSFLLSTLTARNYLENQLTVKNSDNAASLALSMSQQAKDPVTVELQVAALYDSGQYALIRLRDPDGQVMIEKTSPGEKTVVPEWFRALLPLEPLPGHAQVSDGWTQFASIELVSQDSFAYEELWRGSQQLLLWFLLGGVLGGLIGSLMLSRITRPLQEVVTQAQAITQRRFTKKPLPRIPELRSVAQAMNDMVDRLKSMFDEEAARLEQVRRQANQDPLTGLSNRSYFMNQLEAALQNDELPPEGSLLLLRIADLAGINRRLGREGTDELLCRTAQALNAQSTPEGSMAARLNGADFALLLPGQTENQQLAENLLHAMQNLAAAGWGESTPIAYVAYGRYQHGESPGQLLARVDSALAAAESGMSGRACPASDSNTAGTTSQQDWRRILEEAIHSQQLRLIEFPVNTTQGKLLHLECPLRLQACEGGEWLAAGSFMPVASRLNLTSDLDLAAIRMALERIKAGIPSVAVNISGESVQDPDFRRSLAQQLGEHPECRDRLWLEVAEPGAFQHFEAFSLLCESLRPHGCHLGIEHFGRQFSDIGRLHGLGLDYLKVDASFIRNIHTQPGNQAFLKGLCGIAHTIGLTVIAEGVQNPEELAALPELGFDGATGPGIRQT